MTISCPRCEVELRDGRRETLLCATCLGIFVPRQAMKTVLSALRDGHNIEAAMDPYRSMHRTDARIAERSHYLKCPACTDLMNRTELVAGAGVVVNMCLTHGVWFDRGDLSHAAGFVQERRRAEGRQEAAREALVTIAAAVGRYFRL